MNEFPLDETARPGSALEALNDMPELPEWAEVPGDPDDIDGFHPEERDRTCRLLR